MYKAFLFLVCLLVLEDVFVLGSYKNVPAPCPAGWYSYRGSKSCYKVSLRTAQTWLVARKACLSLGGDLVVVESQAENDYVAFLAQTVLYGSYSIFLGMMRDRTNIFKWVNGKPLSSTHYTNWIPKGGQAVAERCAQLYTHITSLGFWNDCYCEKRKDRNYICEREKMSFY